MNFFMRHICARNYPLTSAEPFRISGDYAVKAVGVIPDPETFIFELETVDRFMILGENAVHVSHFLSFSLSAS